MRLKIDGLNIPEETQIKLAGLDIPGDITQPCRSLAEWIAHISSSETIEISHFLTSVFVITAEWISKYWRDGNACRKYLDRQHLSNRSREAILEAAWNWGFENVRFNPETEQFLTIVDRQNPRPKPTDKLKRLLSEATQRARSVGLPCPKIEHVLVCLVENPEYEEQSAIQDSEINVELFQEALRNNNWSIPAPE